MTLGTIAYFLVLNTFFLAIGQTLPQLQLPTGENVDIEIVTSVPDQTKGLSGRKVNTFPKNRGMLFLYQKDGPRQFWMPNTYFDLDIFFLDKNYKILAVERKVKAHPGRDTPPPIARTKVHYCRHVLELRADSKISKKIKVGSTLKWSRHPKIK